MIASKPCVALRTLCALCITTTLLTACSILPKTEPVQIWQPPAGASTAATTHANFSLRIDTPEATGMLADTAIVVMPASGQVSTYQGARWNNPPPVLVRHRLVDAFMTQLPSVTTSDDHFASDYTLSGDLRAFQSEYRAGTPVVVVRLDAQLRRGGSRRLLATHSFVITQKPTDDDVAQVVKAFGAADDALAAQVVAWVVEQVRQAPAPSSSDAGNSRQR